MATAKIHPAYYPDTTGKADPSVTHALNHLRSLVHDLQVRTDQIGESYLPKTKAHELYSPGTQRKALQVGGSHPASIHNLRGIAYEPQIPGVPFVNSLPTVGQFAQPSMLVWQPSTNHLFLNTATVGVNWVQLV